MTMVKETIIRSELEYRYFNDMPVFEILKRIKKLPIVEPTEQWLYKGWGYIYSDAIDEFIEAVYRLRLIDKLTWIFPEYELNKLKKKWIDGLSIYELLVIISANITAEKFCPWIILWHVQNWNFKNRVQKMRDLESQLTEENVDTEIWAKIIYGLTKDIRRFKPLFSCEFTYAQTIPDIPHFYVVIDKQENDKILVLFDRFKKYLKYFWKIFSRKGELCQMIEYKNHYYRIYRELLYRIPMDIETFENDMAKVELDTYFWTLNEIRKNWKSTVSKIKSWKQLIPVKHDRSWVIYTDWHIEHNNKKGKWTSY